MEDSDLYAEDHHWGDKPIDVRGRSLPALKIRYLLQNLPVTGRALEFGCGSGKLLNTISQYRPGLELHGCDIRPLRYVPEHFSFTQLEQAHTTLPYEAHEFDAVLMVDVLEHLVDPPVVLNGVRNVLRPEGRLVSFTPLEGQPFSFYRIFRRILGDDLYRITKEHTQTFSEASLRGLLETDFVVVDFEYVYHLFGHLMDATLFALLASQRLRNRFWQENPFYDESLASSDGRRRQTPLAVALQIANIMAYLESRVLRRVRLTSAGLLFAAAPR